MVGNSYLLDKLLDEMEDNVRKKELELFPPGIRNIFVRNRKKKSSILYKFIMNENMKINQALKGNP